MPFLTRYGVDEKNRKEREQFLELTEADKANVRRLREVFARHAVKFAERF